MKSLCVDYTDIIKLLPPVTKFHCKAKGIITLVPLPKIDGIYTRLNDSCIHSTFDVRNHHYHVTLLDERKTRSISVTLLYKFEFTKCPSGLVQALVYFQQLIYEVLRDLEFIFWYLDYFLVFSQNVETHLKHLWILFDRLKEADLKCKEIKCNFLKTHGQYLGHLISG